VTALLATALACSFGVTERVPCRSDDDCRDAFGWGHTCDADQLCATATLHPRCETTPADLFEDRAAHQDDIVLGVLWRIESYPMEADAAKLAFLEVADAGGLDGRALSLVTCGIEEDPDVDDLDGETATSTIAEYLARDVGVAGSVGPTSSGESERAYAAASPHDSLLISASATSPALTTMDGATCSDDTPGLFWRTAPSDELQGQVMADYLSEQGRSPVAVIYEEGAYGQGLATAFSASFSGEVQLQPYATSSAIPSYVVDLVDTTPEIIFISSVHDDIVAFLNAMADLLADGGRVTDGLFLADGAYYTTILDAVEDPDAVLPLVRGTRPTADQDSLAYETFAAAFGAAFPGSDAREASFAANAYDAAWMLLYGVAWASYQEDRIGGENVARGLRQLSSGDSIDIRYTNWNPVRAAFEAGDSVDIRGASGELDYDTTTCETSAPIEIWAVAADKEGGYEFTQLEVRE